MSPTIYDQAKLYMAMAKKARDPDAILTASEETAFRGFVSQYGGGTVPGLPQNAPGDARGLNAMRRTNWFNGRFLTAEALRRQDAYFDVRARLDAHLLMPGVAYGLGLSAVGLNRMPLDGDGQTPPTSGGFGKTETITLSPGLAFDQLGRPIHVALPFAFTLEQLIATHRNLPRRVAPGGTDFAPCVCVVPEPAGPSGGSGAVRPGCYLLIIEPGEVPEGEAKVYGEACAGGVPGHCQTEAWRGAFGLSLVRVPLELPEEEGLSTAWALRGTASAWWFDVFEHSLIKRWDPNFATDGGFTKPVGPGRHDSGTVPLAMVWLGTDGSAIFLDRWIPRRSIVATPGEDWHRTRFGAPPRAAAWARIHQFQAMLDESLDRLPLQGGEKNDKCLNLWQRGFRHIPPIGFLPLDPDVIGDGIAEAGGSTGNETLDRIVKAGGGRIQMVAGLIAGAREQAVRYFEGTTVFPYCVVALHDDDLLEDLANVFDKDPVQVAQRRRQELEILDDADTLVTGPLSGYTKESAGFATDKTFVAEFLSLSARLELEDEGRRGLYILALFVDRLGAFFDLFGLDELVNRRTEVVKLIIPLQGLARAHPIVGVVAEDAREQASAWLGRSAPAPWDRDQRLKDARGMSGLRQSLPLEMLPRHFAVYVKQRMVLLDILVVLIETLQALVTLVRDLKRDAGGRKKDISAPLQTQDYVRAYHRQPAEKRAIMEAAFAEPLVRDAVARAAIAASPDLRLPSRNAEFTSRVKRAEMELATQIPEAGARQRAAWAQVADAYATEYPGFQVMQIVAAVQLGGQAEKTFAAITAEAVRQPLRDNATGARVGSTVADDVMADGPREFAKPEAAGIYASMNEALAEESATAFAPDAPKGVTAKEILSKSRAEAVLALGGEANLTVFTEAVTRQKAAAATAASAIAAAPPPPEIAAKLAQAMASGQDAGAAVEALKAGAGNDAAQLAYLDAAGRLIGSLGAERALKLARIAANRRER